MTAALTRTDNIRTILLGWLAPVNRLFRMWLMSALLAVPMGVACPEPADPLPPPTYAIPLTVVDDYGEPFTGLTGEQLALKGVAARIQLTSAPQHSQLVFLLDISPSMRWQGPEYSSKWQTAKTLLAEFVEAANPSQRMGLHAYGERHEVLVPPTTDREALLARLRELPEPSSAESATRWGKLTAFGDSLKASLETGLGFGDVIVVVADSLRDDRSKAKLDAVVRLGVERGVRVYFANVQPPFSDPPGPVGPRLTTTFPGTAASPGGAPRIEPYEVWIHNPGSRPESPIIRKAVEGTGGQSLFLWTGATYYYPGRFDLPPDGLKKVVRQAWATILASYRLELHLDTELPKKRKIEVNVMNQGKKRTGVRIYHPSHLFPVHR